MHWVTLWLFFCDTYWISHCHKLLRLIQRLFPEHRTPLPPPFVYSGSTRVRAVPHGGDRQRRNLYVDWGIRRRERGDIWCFCPGGILGGRQRQQQQQQWWHNRKRTGRGEEEGFVSLQVRSVCPNSCNPPHDVIQKYNTPSSVSLPPRRVILTQTNIVRRSC